MSDNVSQNAGVQFVAQKPLEDKATGKVKAYVSNHPSVSMNRQDGKRIVFINNFFETDSSADQKYLDEEIDEHKNLYIRHAREDEIRLAHIRLDPMNVAKQDIQNDEDFMAKLREQVKKDLLDSGEVKHVGTPVPAIGGQAKVIDTGGAKVIITPPRLTPSSTANLPEGSAGASNSAPAAGPNS